MTSISPKSESCSIRVRARSLASSASNLSTISRRCSGSPMSMKSMTRRPPRSAQADLPRDLGHRFEVRREDRVLERVLADELPGVDVDRDERLRLLDDERASRGQLDPALQGVLDLRLDAERLEERRVARSRPPPWERATARRPPETRRGAPPSPRRRPGSRRSPSRRGRGRRAARGRARDGGARERSPVPPAARSAPRGPQGTGGRRRAPPRRRRTPRSARSALRPAALREACGGARAPLRRRSGARRRPRARTAGRRGSSPRATGRRSRGDPCRRWGPSSPAPRAPALP